MIAKSLYIVFCYQKYNHKLLWSREIHRNILLERLNKVVIWLHIWRIRIGRKLKYQFYWWFLKNIFWLFSNTISATFSLGSPFTPLTTSSTWLKKKFWVFWKYVKDWNLLYKHRFISAFHNAICHPFIRLFDCSVFLRSKISSSFSQICSWSMSGPYFTPWSVSFKLQTFQWQGFYHF